MFGVIESHICFNKMDSILNALACVRVSVRFEKSFGCCLFESKT